MARIDVEVLGRPHVVIDGVTAPLSGRQLALGVRLALGRNVPVSSRRLLDLWPEEVGTSGALRVALTRLRQVLGPNAVVRVDDGYTLAPPPHLDADRFEHLLRRARDEDLPAAERIASVDEGLRLWRGPSFDGLERLPWVEYEAVRLDELREQAVDLRLELVARAHGHDLIIPELAAELERTPGRERRAALLATALYHAGRQTDALDVVAQFRGRLRDDFGLELGRELRELETAILRHDLPGSGPSGGASSDGAALEQQLRAASAFLRAGAPEEAEIIASQALGAARAAGDRRAAARCLLALAQTAGVTGADAPDPLVDEAQALARSLGDGALLARAALVRFGRGLPHDRTAALIEIGEPLDMLASTAPERIDLLCAAAAIISLTDAGPVAQRMLLSAERTHSAQHSSRSRAVWMATRVLVGAVDGLSIELLVEWADDALAAARAADDPAVVTVAIHAVLRVAYMTGDLDAVDALLDELALASQRAPLPFGTLRVALCKVTNALARGQLDDADRLIGEATAIGRRIGARSTESAILAQGLVLALERGTLTDHLPVIRAMSDDANGGVWLAVAGLCGDDGDRARLAAGRERSARDDAYGAAIALTALAAARWRDAELGAWCAAELEALDDQTVTVGLGTVVLGFGRFFAGVARLAAGESEAARIHLERAVELSNRAGAELWRVQARLWLAEALYAIADESARREADALVRELCDSPVLAASPRARRRLEQLTARSGDR